MWTSHIIQTLTKNQDHCFFLTSCSYCKVCIILLVHIYIEKFLSTFWQVYCCAHRTWRSCQKYDKDFFSNFVAFSENPNFIRFELKLQRNFSSISPRILWLHSIITGGLWSIESFFCADELSPLLCILTVPRIRNLLTVSIK